MMRDNSSSSLATRFSGPPTVLTQKPNSTEKTMSGSMFRRENSSPKSLTVNARTSASASGIASTPSPAPSAIRTPSAGGNAFTASRIATAATAPVATNTTSIQPRILPSRRMFSMLPTALEMVTNTSGTTTVNIRLRKISPRGLSAVARSPNASPMAAPTRIEASRTREKR